jgi:hypothetical protein
MTDSALVIKVEVEKVFKGEIEKVTEISNLQAVRA